MHLADREITVEDVEIAGAKAFTCLATENLETFARVTLEFSKTLKVRGDWYKISDSFHMSGQRRSFSHALALR